MDRLDAMRLFVRVADVGSFSAVAQQLAVARSVVTRQVAALETHLRVKLLARSTRRLSLTSAGAVYLEKCRVILNLVESAETSLTEELVVPRGRIRLSVPLSFGVRYLGPLLLEFARRCPEVTLDVDYSDRRSNLFEEGVDLAVRIAHRLEPGDVARRIGSSRLFVVAAPAYLSRHGAVRLDATRVGRDASRIAEEVIAHLESLGGADVRVTLEIDARLPNGVPNNVVRIVTENCRTLKFESHGFEKE
jgi:DNA-binding transcriptional LysR family regulator